MRLCHRLGEGGEYPTDIFSEPRGAYRMAVGETREPSEPGAGGRMTEPDRIPDLDWF